MKKALLLASACLTMAYTLQAQTILPHAIRTFVADAPYYYESDGILGNRVLPATGVASENNLNITNPSIGATQIEILSAFRNNGAALSITDPSGKELFWHALDNQTSISVNTTSWAKGVYFVRLQNADGKTPFQKISVQ